MRPTSFILTSNGRRYRVTPYSADLNSQTKLVREINRLISAKNLLAVQEVLFQTMARGNILKLAINFHLIRKAEIIQEKKK